MVIREHKKYYNTNDLVDFVNSSLLNDEVKDILLDYIDDISLYEGEIYHQLTRQSLSIPIYNRYKEITNFFGNLIFNCISSESVDRAYIEKQIKIQSGLISQLLFTVEPVVAVSVYDRLKEVADIIDNVSNEFLSKCNGLVVNNQDIYDVNTDLNDYLQPKSYKTFKLNVNIDKNEEDVTESENDSIFDNTWNRINKPDIKIMSLKKSGLRVRPIEK